MQRVNVDLSINRPQPVVFNIVNGKRVRFHVVPGSAEVRIQVATADAIPVNEPFTLENCSANPWTKLWISNQASTGSLVILVTDGSEDFDDFLGSGGVGPQDSFLFQESINTHAWIHASATNPQDVSKLLTDGMNYTVYNAGIAQQFRDDTNRIYSSRLASVLGSNAALNGGRVFMSLVARNAGAVAANLNNLSNSVPTYTRNLGAQRLGGMYYFETDAFLHTPTIAVAGNLFAGFGFGWDFAGSVAANGPSGQRGVGLIWSNGMGNNNWWFVVANTGVGFITAQDTGILATGQHRMLRLEWGFQGLLPIIRAKIDNNIVASLNQIPQAFGLDLALTLTNSLLTCTAGKLTINQNGNQVDFSVGGYQGFQVGRMLPQ